jgi:hypothetical protein
MSYESYQSWRTETRRKSKGAIPVSSSQNLSDCIQKTFDYLGWYEPFIVTDFDENIVYKTYGGE